jgi:hypothetical protein
VLCCVVNVNVNVQSLNQIKKYNAGATAKRIAKVIKLCR